MARKRIWSNAVLGGVMAMGLLVTGAGQPAKGDIIYSNFGPNDSFGGGAWYVGFTGEIGTIQDVAVPFRLGSQALNLGKIEVVMYFDSMLGQNSGPNVVGLKILPDVNNRPGPDNQALESFHLVDALSTDLPPKMPVVVNSVLHPLLQPDTTYWLLGTASPPTQDSWYENSIGVMDGLLLRVNNGDWQDPGAFVSQPVFRISGSSPIPEPATLLLLGIGTLGMICWRSARIMGRCPTS
jgi:hypothetical protein